MPAGVEVIVEDGFATVTPDREHRGAVVRALLAAVDHPSQVRTDTGGLRRSYVVLEQDARKAGLLDEKPVKKRAPRKPRKAPAEPVVPIEPPTVEDAPTGEFVGDSDKDT